MEAPWYIAGVMAQSVRRRPPLRTTGVLALITAGLTIPASARQRPPEPTPAPSSGSQIEVYLVTMGPGEQSWERFGHNGIWVRDPGHGVDAVYNYGLFSFEQDGFLLRFLRGRMMYWMQGLPAESHLEWYRSANRSVWIQELNLSSAQRVEIRDFLLWNERPENRLYRYDYYLDNCSTRVRDAIDRVLGGRIQEQTQDARPGTTFRFHTRRLTTADLPLFTGLTIGLGRFVDRPISVWEEMFLPLKVREHVRDVTVLAADGRAVPLVRSERTLFESTVPPERTSPPTWWPGYLVLGLGLATVLAALARTATSSDGARIAFAATATIWACVSGVLGTILAALWLLTDHTAAHWNENLLLFSPLTLALAAVIPFSVRAWPRAARWAKGLSLAVAVLALLALVGKVLPGFYQANGELVALALPPTLALAWGVRRVVTQ